MTTITKFAEALSGLLLLSSAWRYAHHGVNVTLLVIEAIAAFAVAWTFPRKMPASIVALGLAVAVVGPILYQVLTSGIMPGIDSPVVGFAFLPAALLVLVQLIASAGACWDLTHRNAAT
jgi:hypothetical protein